MKSGVYIFINKQNNKCYVGSSYYMVKRKSDHLCLLRSNKHHSIHLQRAWNKHGEDSFLWFILERCNENNLVEREQYYLDLLKPEYNIEKIAYSSLGVKRSKETCIKIGLSKLGNKNWLGKEKPLAMRLKISNSLKGNTIRKGKKVLDTTKIKLGHTKRLAKYANGELNPPRINITKFGKINKYSKDGKILICTYSSPYEAAEMNSLDRNKGGSKIIRACKDSYRTAYGYKWSFCAEAQVKQDELLESPTLIEDNQQPNLISNDFEGSTTNSRVLTGNAEDSNANTSVLPFNSNVKSDDIV